VDYDLENIKARSSSAPDPAQDQLTEASDPIDQIDQIDIEQIAQVQSEQDDDLFANFGTTIEQPIEPVAAYEQSPPINPIN
jgi:hypothetical protein